MGAFISLAFRMRGELSNLRHLDAKFNSVGLELAERGPVEEGQEISAWRVHLDGEIHVLTRRCYGDGGEISTTLDIEADVFDQIGQRLGRERLIARFVELGCALLRELDLVYVFFEEEAEADIALEAFDGTRLFGISIVPADVPWLETISARADVKRIDRFPGATVIYRRLDTAPELG